MGFCSSVTLLLYAPIQRRKETIFHRFHKLDSALMDSPCAKFCCLSLPLSVSVSVINCILRLAICCELHIKIDSKVSTGHSFRFFAATTEKNPSNISSRCLCLISLWFLFLYRWSSVKKVLFYRMCVCLFVSLFPITKVNRMREAIKQRRYFVFYVCVPSAHPSHKHRRHTRSHKHKHTYNHMIVQNFPNHARRSTYTRVSAVLWLCGGDGGG